MEENSNIQSKDWAKALLCGIALILILLLLITRSSCTTEGRVNNSQVDTTAQSEGQGEG